MKKYVKVLAVLTIFIAVITYEAFVTSPAYSGVYWIECYCLA